MISVCIITKNESADLERCLKQLVKYPMEIVVVDTGSTDDTMEMVKKYTDQVYEFTWCDDFSKARNFAISKAHQPWIMTIDSDEYIEEFDYDAALRLLKKHPGEIGRIKRINLLDRLGEEVREQEWLNRVFEKDRYYYQGYIHEQICAVSIQPEHSFQIPLSMIHSGYQGTRQEIDQKADRNIRLLEKQKNELESAGKQDPYVLYQLGKSYFMKHDYTNALVYFNLTAAFDLNPRLEYVLDYILAYGYSLLAVKDYDLAYSFEGIYQEFSYSADFQFLMGLIYMNNSRFSQAISEFKKAAGQKVGLVEGVNSYKAFYNIGVIYECLGNMKEALHFYSQCDTYEKAKMRIKAISKS